jgi:hypothetical protein
MDPLLNWMEMWPYYFIRAARQAAEATFSLDGRAAKALGRIAKRWGVPRVGSAPTSGAHGRTVPSLRQARVAPSHGSHA